ncbi:sensor domain-containing protein [Usitatibacter rugosus]|uniref:sensor domain-containing protein n=1 Tax=Usitatibacter rugosus TaxID=2732067 RepID=UPI001BB1D983|nr:EAL domain-containing protein [Usitatibacter rugosus]
MRSAPGSDVNAEVSALIDTLHRAGQRLEELTAGEIDAVADQHGMAYLLPRAQELVRQGEAAKKAAILNALPAHIALIDMRGVIVSVNDAWHRFAAANAVQGAGHGIGANYLEICDRAAGPGSAGAVEAAVGIRSVLTSEAPRFSMEYACDSPELHRWFLMTVTPLGHPPSGAVVMHLDITEKEAAAQGQRDLRQLLDNIVENIPTAVQVKSVRDDFRIRMWNKAAEAMYGVPREEAIGRHVQDLWPKADADPMHASDLELAATGRMQEYVDRRATTRDRGDIHVHMRKVALRNDAGQATHLLVITDDITMQLADRARLRESERRLTDMLEHVRLVAVMLDRDARVTYCNEFFLSLTGWKRDEVIGQDWFERFMPPELGDMKPTFLDLLDNLPSAWHVENEIYTRMGERRLVRWNNSVLRSPAGDVIGVASIGEDITEQKENQDSRQQSDERTRSIVELALDAVVVMDSTGSIVDWNTQAEKTFGWTRDEVAGTPLAAVIIPPQHRERHVLGLARFLETGTGAIINRRVELTAMHRDGHEFPVELAISPLRLAGKWIFSAFIRDLTDRKDAERKITRLNRVYAVLSGINTLIVRVRDHEDLFQDACRIAVEDGSFVGAWIGMVDRPGMRIVRVASSGLDEAFFDIIEDRLSLLDDSPAGHGAPAVAVREKRSVVVNDVETVPYVLHKKAHAQRGIRAVVSLPLMIDGDPVGVLNLYAADANVFDEAELRLLSELTGDIAYAINYLDKRDRLDYLAYYDVLTGLANRTLFLERVSQYIRSAATGKHGLAVFLFDLERFKSINDSLGQPAGDELLRQVAQWITQDARDANLAARLGADHFALVLPEIKPGGSIERLLEKAIKGFAEHPFNLNGAVYRIAAKVGVALYPGDGANADELLKQAEAALKTAKASGDRYAFYAPRMTESSAGTLTLENQLRQALEKEQFVLHFQPKMNLASGGLTGAEALIRWNDPATGLVPPGRFIPILEETGLIHEVGRWALHKAIAEYLHWRAARRAAVRVSVNVSPRQLRDRGFVRDIRNAIDVDPHAAAGLELEITESLIMEDVKNSIASLQAIREMGVTIAIDDFGTGFSSLSYLSKLPVDTLKIDRSFVVDMTTGPQGLSLVSTIITLAHSLKLCVVAEGVETAMQSRLLHDLRCDEIQGYLYGKPVPSAEFEARYLLP